MIILDSYSLSGPLKEGARPLMSRQETVVLLEGSFRLYIQGPSFKLILWFLHDYTHLGFFFENIEVGKETCAIQASNEPLIDEIDRTSDEL